MSTAVVPTPSRTGRSGGPVPWLVAALATAVWTVFAVTQWRLLESPSWDLGIFTQLAKDYANLSAPVVTIKGEGFNLLGDHFHPLLVVLGPLYRLFPSALTLLVVQAVLLGLSAVPVTSVARERLGALPGTALGVAYALSWGLQGAVAAQFHEIALAVPLLAMSLAAFLRGRWWACAAWAAPLVLVKEDLGLTVAALGLVLLRRSRSRGGGAPSVRVGAVTTAWGLGWFVLTIAVLLPALNPHGTWDYYDRLGDEEHGTVLDVLAGAFVPGEKYVTVLLLVAAAGVVGVRSPLVALWVPTLAWRFLGNVDHYWGWTWHYSAILMPVAAAALIDAVRPGVLDAARRRGWAAIGVSVALATTILMTPTTPVARLADRATYELPPRHGAAAAAVAAVPEGATVETDIYLMAYLVPRAQVYWIGNTGNPAPDAVAMDTRRPTWPGADITDVAQAAERRHPGTGYELVLDSGGYQVALRTGADS